MMIPIRGGRETALALGVTLTAITAGGGCGDPATAQPAQPDLHGAAPADRQEAALERLLPADVIGTPVGVDPVAWATAIPADNAMTPARVALGRKLYFDPRLSADGTVSCATCHDVTRSFTDLRATSEGIKDQIGFRNSPTSMNAALLQLQFWDGRAITLEDQAKLPILNPIEMGMPSEAAAMKAIAGDATYQRMFREAYGRKVNYDDLARAIATFERTLIFLDAPADRYLAGDDDAIGADAVRGWLLYNGKARCVSCHPFNPSNPLGTDNRFHNVGVSARHQRFSELAERALAELAKGGSQVHIETLATATQLSELGRFLVTRNYADIGGFRTPQVRNAGITAPYMHDGTMATLWDVMDHYNRGGEANPWLDGGIEALALTEQEIDDVVAFLFTMTDRRFAEQNAAELKRQRELSRSKRPFREPDLATRKRLGFEPRPQVKP